MNINIYSLRFVCSIFCFMLCVASNSQGFKVKSFKQSLSDGSAFHAPSDVNGHPCGLIKVQTDCGGLRFKGDIVGDVENKMNEYWVYLPQRSKMLTIIHPNFIPFSITMEDYAISVSPKATYILSLEETKYKKEKTGVTITVKPEDAALYVDDILIDNGGGNGYYQLFLPKGEHICRFIKPGYNSNVQFVQTGKTSQTISVELESVMAELDVGCKTMTAEIYIDGELKGNGSWRGTILAGEHQIEARQKNYETNIQTVSLAEKESRTFVIPELKRSMGRINIVTDPSGIDLIVDGKNVGASPCTIDVETGKHYVSCKSYGIEQTRLEIEVNSDKTETVTLGIKYTDSYLKDDYQGAYNGNLKDILTLTIEAGRHKDYEQAFYWIDKHPQKDYIIEHWTSYWKDKPEDEQMYGYWQFNWIEMYSLAGNPQKALELFPIAKNEEESHGGLFLDELYMKYIGDAFLKKNEIDKAIPCFEKAERDGLGDCYATKGNKQLAANYYRKCLNLDYYDGKNRVEKKLKELK